VSGRDGAGRTTDRGGTARRTRSRAVAATACAGLVGTLAIAGSTPSQASTASAQLWLAQGSGKTVVERFPGEPLFLDTGAYVVAGSQAVRLDVSRPSYKDSVRGVQVISSHGARTTRNLPKGAVKDFSGLQGFFSVTVAKSGRTVARRTLPFCPNGYDVQRARPDAPDASPYPADCTANPFSRGAVWGLQAGWSTSAAGDPFQSPKNALKLRDGTYTVTTTIAPRYRAFFGVPAKRATVVTSMKVVTAREGDPRGGLRAGTSQTSQTSQTSTSTPTLGHAPTGRNAVPVAGPRPDLQALPAWGFRVENNSTGEGEEAGPRAARPRRDYLDFAATVWNAGPSQLVVNGFRRPGTKVMDAYQYFYDVHGRQVSYAKVGTMRYDGRASHQHWHFKDFARYSLLDRTKKHPVVSGKEAFCLADTDAVDLLVAGARWRPDQIGLGSACGDATSIAISEVLSTGWGDTYDQSRAGQSFDITDLPNGTYYVQVLANPEHRLVEGSARNNVSYRRIVLKGTRHHRKVVVPDYQAVHAP
jgi:hypothetical protein